MSIVAACPCGKRFAVKDDFAGRKARCPACKAVIVIPATSAQQPEIREPVAASVAASAKSVAPAAPRRAAARIPAYPGSSRPTAPATQAASGFHMSPKMIILVALLILIPTGIFIVKAGPVKAVAQWQELEPRLTGWTGDTVKKVLEKEYEGIELKAATEPKVTNIMLDTPIMMWSLPADIALQGKTTEGHYKGVYHTGPRTFEIEVGVVYDHSHRTIKAHVESPKDEVVVDEISSRS